MSGVWVLREGGAGESIRECIEQGVVTVGFSGSADVSRLHRGELQQFFEAIDYPGATSQLCDFRDQIAIGDLLISPMRQPDAFHLVRVTGPYRWSPAPIVEDHHHWRAAEWSELLEKSLIPSDLGHRWPRKTLTRVREVPARWFESLSRPDQSEVPAFDGNGEFPDAADDASDNTSVGQGSMQDGPRRRAIERRAVDMATTHFEALGFRVEDVGDSASWDLECFHSDGEIHVEVKGTTGGLGEVELTANEVAHARSTFPSVALAIVTDIDVGGTTATPLGSGGRLVVWNPWHLEDGELRPSRYAYVPPASGWTWGQVRL